MKIFEEILEHLPLEKELIHSKAKIILYGKKLAYFENVKKILAFSPQELILLTKDGKIAIQGENFVIAQYGDGDLILQGIVQAVQFLD